MQSEFRSLPRTDRHERGRFPRGMPLDARLLQDPYLDGGMPLAQQVERAPAIVLLCGRARFVAHDLRHHTRRHLHPLGQATERAAQTVDREPIDTCLPACGLVLP